MPDVFVSDPTTKKSAPKKSATTAAPTAAAAAIASASQINPFSAFCINPIGVSFVNQDANETILLFLRRHFVTNVPWIVITIFLLFVPLLISFLLQTSSLPLTFLPQQYMTILLLFYYLIVFAYVLANFMSWFYNIGIVTNVHIVDIDFSDIVYHDVAITKLSQVEETRFQQIGFIPSLFDFGDVYLETSSDTPNFEFLKIPHPARANKLIGDLLSDEVKK